MVDYLYAFKRPFENWKTLIIGVIIGIISTMTFGIIGLFLTGFGIFSAKEIFANRTALPEWKNWLQLLIDGIQSAIIGIIYFIPAIIFFAAGAIAALSTILQFGAIASTGNITQISGLIGQFLAAAGPLFLVGMILAIPAILALPMGLSFFAKEGFGSAFHFKRIVKKCFTGKYIISLIVILVFGIIYAIIGSIITLIFFLFPYVGSLISAGLIGYLFTVTFYTLFAQTLKELG